MTSTRLPYDRYLAHVDADAGRIAELLQGDLAARVPSCPDWTLGDLGEHVAHVYLHKVACIREGRPETWPPERDQTPTPEFFAQAYAELRETLKAHQPADPSWTWWEPEQTVGFWARRMAQESLVHRVDAELASGHVGAVDQTLALDGVDELLNVFLGHPDNDYAVSDGPTRNVLIRSGTHGWLVTLSPDGPSVEVIDDNLTTLAATADTAIIGGPADLELWLWNRGPIDRLHVEGDPGVVPLLHDALVDATQ